VVEVEEEELNVVLGIEEGVVADFLVIDLGLLSYQPQ